MAAPPANKRVIEEVSGWLRVFDDGSVSRAWTGPPDVLPMLFPVPAYSSPIDGISLFDLPGKPTLRFYVPSPSTPSFPVLVHFHGGGFCISHFSWRMYHDFYSRLALTLSAVVISVDLPLAPEHRLPAAHNAAFQALLHLRSIARSTGDNCGIPFFSEADFTRVFLIGDSTGGNIVHEMAAKAGRVEEADPGFWHPVQISGGVAIHPGFVQAERSAFEMKVEWESPFLTLDMMDKFIAMALPEGAGRDHPYTCPMGKMAPPMEGLKMPPIMVAVAEKDFMRDTELEYCEAMKNAGKEVEVFYQDGVCHSFYLYMIAVEKDSFMRKKRDELILTIKNFVDRH